MNWAFPQLAFCIFQGRKNSHELTALQLLGDKAVKGWFFKKGDSLKVSFGNIVAMTHGTREPGQHAEAQGIPHIYSLPTCFVTVGCNRTTSISFWIHWAEQTDRCGDSCGTRTVYLLCSYLLTFTMPCVHFCSSFSAGERSLVEF